MKWTIIFQYLNNALDSWSTADSTSSSGDMSADSQVNNPVRRPKFLERLKKSLLTPPSQGVMWGIIIGCVPHLPEMFVNDHGSLRPVLLSITQIGSVTVPLSSMIVGAELYHAMRDSLTDDSLYEIRPSETFGNGTIVLILVTRLILMPWIGRTVHRAFRLAQFIPDPLLSVFVLVEWAVPTANNAIIMVSIIAGKSPTLGARIRQDVSKCLFWQYVTLPVFLTLNTVLSLRLQYS